MSATPRGSVVQWQIVTTDPDAATRFYAKLFGWKTSTANALGYREIDTGPDGMAGGMWPAPKDSRSFVQLFVRVDDVQRSVDDAKELGATVIVPVTALPDGDTIAILADPMGITFGLMAAK